MRRDFAFTFAALSAVFFAFLAACAVFDRAYGWALTFAALEALAALVVRLVEPGE